MTWHLLTSPDNARRWEADGQAEAIMDMLEFVHHEDMDQCAKVDAGLRSGTLSAGRLVELETPIAHFHRWLGERLALT